MISKKPDYKTCGSDFCELLGKLNKSSAHTGNNQENGLMLTPKINTHLLRTDRFREVIGFEQYPQCRQ